LPFMGTSAWFSRLADLPASVPDVTGRLSVNCPTSRPLACPQSTSPETATIKVHIDSQEWILGFSPTGWPAPSRWVLPALLGRFLAIHVEKAYGIPAAGSGGLTRRCPYHVAFCAGQDPLAPGSLGWSGGHRRGVATAMSPTSLSLENRARTRSGPCRGSSGVA
jgi:hypothetical protein